MRKNVSCLLKWLFTGILAWINITSHGQNVSPVTSSEIVVSIAGKGVKDFIKTELDL